jgi:2-polyprenyl-3-methyl-5-hydroxy-6-metoxy-1,4-benzoquinol methylase
MSASEEVKYKNKVDKYSSHSLIIKKINEIAPLSNNILDLGCFTGELLNRVRINQDVSNNFFGADLENFVRKDFNFIKFYLLDFNSTNLSDVFDNKKFDIVILGDVLEHLVNPWDALNSVDQITHESSNVLISMPNSGHWYFRLKVLFGRIEYTNNGLFDKTHLRFFTRKSSAELINGSNFKVVSTDYSSIPWENLFKRGMASKVLSIFERFLIFLRPQLFAYQFIFLVKPVRRDK